LISLIDYISPEKSGSMFGYDLRFFQFLSLVLSFGCLIGLVSIGIFKEHWLSNMIITNLSLFHIWANSVVILASDFNLKDIFSMVIGIYLFSLIIIAEIMRRRQVHKKDEK